MNDSNHPAETLKDIKKMMERSSRFISLSGLSGIAAGVCALAGAWFAYKELNTRYMENRDDAFFHRQATASADAGSTTVSALLHDNLFIIAVLTFVAAFTLAFIFTYLRSKKTKIPLWGSAARRLLINVSIPMIAGGIYLFALLQNGVYDFIAPGCLLFYGLALVNASKYTLGEVRYLGYGQVLLALMNLFFSGYGLIFWAFGFGLLHIIYGTVMWWKYEKDGVVNS